jgi:WD40 repeat protein
MIAPYVGPGPVGREQDLFGRAGEIEELHWRLVADRIIVLYSPSGAGKTSLLSAKNGLLAQLRTRFLALPILRVGGDQGTDPVKAILRQLEASAYGPAQDGDRLLDYFNRIDIPKSQPPKRLLLVIDQFEEVFLNGASLAEQRDFFKQLGELLSRDTSPIWTILSMREEYFSWLDPFRDALPTRLSNTFRLNLLSTEQAIAAIKGPAQAAGVAFPAQDGEDAATHLVRELSKVRRRDASGAMTVQDGAKVESVQLQVICLDLWKRLSAQGQPVDAIRIADVVNYNPDNALQEYCDDALLNAATNPRRASLLRDWIDQRLLTPSGLRAPAMLDTADKKCPTPAEVRALEEVHLIRRQIRDDGEWYELSHDSLAVPMRKSIETWRVKNLEAWQQLSRAWQLGGEPAAYFKTLSRHSRRHIPAPSPDDAYSEVETRFLAAYGIFLQQRRLLRVIVAGIIVATVFIGSQYTKYRTQAKLVAEGNITASQAGVFAIIGSHPRISLEARAIVEGIHLQTSNPNVVAFNFKTLLSEYLNRTRNIKSMEYEAESDYVSKKVIQDQHYRVVLQLGNVHPALEISDLTGKQPVRKIDADLLKKIHPNGVRTVALLGDGRLATGSNQDGNIQLWHIQTGQPDGPALRATRNSLAHLMHGTVSAMVVDGDLLFSGYDLGVVAAWNLRSDRSAEPLWTFTSGMHPALSLSANGHSMAVSDFSMEKPVTLLTTRDGTVQARFPREGNFSGTFSSVAISPDGQFLAAGTTGGNIHIWNTGTTIQTHRIKAHDEDVVQLQYLQNKELMSIGTDGRVKYWTFPQNENAALVGKTIVELPNQLVSFAVDAQKHSALVTTKKGDLLNVALSGNDHSFGRFLPGITSFVDLSQAGEKLRLTVATANSLTAGDLDESLPEPRMSTQWLVPGLVGAARADQARTSFLMQDHHIVAVRDTAPGSQPISVLTDIEERVRSIHVNESASLLIVRSNSSTRLWSLRQPDLSATECVDLPAGMSPQAEVVAIRPSGSDVITVRYGELHFWRATEHAGACPTFREDSEVLGQQKSALRFVAFDPSGKNLWAANYNGRVYSLALAKGDPQVTVLQEESITMPSAVAISANGIVAIGDDRGGLQVFQPESPIPIKIANDFHDTEINSLAISKDGKWLASSSGAGTAIWDLRLETWMNRACFLANHRNFSTKDIDTYFKRVSEKPTPCSAPH